jgi:uncharacterized protein (TIGR02996 family)
MTDESAFQAALDADPSNHDLRLVFADWLEEQGDWRAIGYRWMGRHRKFPYRTSRTSDWWDIRWREKLGDPETQRITQELLRRYGELRQAERADFPELAKHFHEVQLISQLSPDWLLLSMIESDLFSTLENGVGRGPRHREYASRRDAEEALCRALQKLAGFSLDTPPGRG